MAVRCSVASKRESVCEREVCTGGQALFSTNCACTVYCVLCICIYIYVLVVLRGQLYRACVTLHTTRFSFSVTCTQPSPICIFVSFVLLLCLYIVHPILLSLVLSLFNHIELLHHHEHAHQLVLFSVLPQRGTAIRYPAQHVLQLRVRQSDDRLDRPRKCILR